MMRGLRVENLESVYNKAVTAISGVSLEVPEGRIVSLVGVNGSGKSTTLNAISGLLRGDPRGRRARPGHGAAAAAPR